MNEIKSCFTCLNNTNGGLCSIGATNCHNYSMWSSRVIIQGVRTLQENTKQTIEQLQARIAELEAENARLKKVTHVSLPTNTMEQWVASEIRRATSHIKEQLAASQLNAEQLREKIEALWGIIDDIDSYGDMAKADDKLFRSLVEKRQKDRWETGITTDGYVLNMPIPHDTSAFDAYVANQREAAYQEARRAAAPFEAELARQRDLAVDVLEKAYEVSSNHDDRLPFDWAVCCEMLWQAISTIKGSEK